jgi:uncharacterized membrane protein required for colicin V production
MEIWIILDLAALAVMALGVFIGAKRGFVRAAYHIAALAATIFLVAMLAQPAADFLIESPIGANMEERIQTGVNTALQTGGGEKSISQILTDSGLPGFLVDYLDTDSFDRAREDTALEVSRSIAEGAAKIIACIVLFLIIRILLWIVLHILDKVCELPVLHFANRVAGAVLGLVNAIVILYVACALVIVLVPVDTLLEINQMVDKTMLFTWFYNHNLILNVLL